MKPHLCLVLSLIASTAQTQVRAHASLGAAAGLSSLGSSPIDPLFFSGMASVAGRAGELSGAVQHSPLGFAAQSRAVDLRAASRAVPLFGTPMSLRVFGAFERLTRSDNPAGSSQRAGRLGLSSEGEHGSLQLSFAQAHYRRAADGESQSLEFRGERRWRRSALAFRVAGTVYPDSSRGVRDTTYIVGGFPFTGTAAWSALGTRSYADLAIEGHHDLGRMRMLGTIGSRTGGLQRDQRGMWGLISAELPIAADLTLVGEAGRRSGLPELGIPVQRFGTIGLRVRALGTRNTMVAARTTSNARTSVSPGENGAVEVAIRGITGRTIEIAGDFSDWLPVTLHMHGDGAAVGNVWSASLRLPAGVHRVAIRINGGNWIAPPGLPSVVGEYGTAVGILVVQSQ